MNEIAPLTSVVAFPAGQILIRENELSRKMYIVKSGTVRVYKTYMGNKITLAVLGRGETFGEFSFFDAQPRSATVETVTDVSAYVIDGATAEKQIKQLPEWMLPLLKSVFNRFREADQKLTILQSMNEFEKKHFGSDKMALTVYQELLRFSNALALLYERELLANKSASEKLLRAEMDQVLGQRQISLQAFFKTLHDHELLTMPKEDELVLVQERFKAFVQFLTMEVNSERLLFLSHSAMALLRRLIGAIETQNLEKETQVELPPDGLELQGMPLLKEAIEELQKEKIAIIRNEKFVIDPANVMYVYFYQSILKSFDHTIAQLE